MKIIHYNQQNLGEILALVESLSDDQYTAPLEILSGASFGQHVRHILEFYICFLRAYTTGVVCYDSRDRNPKIETDRKFVREVTGNIISTLNEITSDQTLKLKADFSEAGNDEVHLKTSVFRELAYVLEHNVHHQALIKVGLRHLQDVSTFNGNFGVASSTVRYRNG